MSYNKSALIGYTGYVGQSLLRQTRFDDYFRSTNISSIDGKSYDLIVCAGAPAQKWMANKNPKLDEENINKLIDSLERVECTKFVLISTVDVFLSPVNVDETTLVDESQLHPYGLHRRKLERFVLERFPNNCIIRLPGLVGPGLRKNIVFDLLNSNNLHLIDSRNIFQFYPMVNLWNDIEIALDLNLKLVHLSSQPISVSAVASACFGLNFENHITLNPVSYDVKSIYASLFGAVGDYQYSMREAILAIRAYAQSESKVLI